MAAIWGIICIENGRKNDLEGENQHIQVKKEELGEEQSTRRKDRK